MRLSRLRAQKRLVVSQINERLAGFTKSLSAAKTASTKPGQSARTTRVSAHSTTPVLETGRLNGTNSAAATNPIAVTSVRRKVQPVFG